MEDITRFEAEFNEFLDSRYPEIPQSIADEKVITEENEILLKKAIEEFKRSFVRS